MVNLKSATGPLVRYIIIDHVRNIKQYVGT